MTSVQNFTWKMETNIRKHLYSRIFMDLVVIFDAILDFLASHRTWVKWIFIQKTTGQDEQFVGWHRPLWCYCTIWICSTVSDVTRFDVMRFKYFRNCSLKTEIREIVRTVMMPCQKPYCLIYNTTFKISVLKDMQF
jgi:hypothetical protein